MKRTKGFTLIELLAVIVILAIIALIATPIVLNMINQAKKSAARSAALGYIEAVEYNIGIEEIGDELSYNQKFDGMVLTVPRKQFETATKGIKAGDGIWDVNTFKKMGLKVKGKAPVSGYLAIQNRKVVGANLCMTDYFVEYTGKDAEAARKCNSDEKEGRMDASYKTSYKAPNGSTASDYSSLPYEPTPSPASPSPASPTPSPASPSGN